MTDTYIPICPSLCLSVLVDVGDCLLKQGFNIEILKGDGWFSRNQDMFLLNGVPGLSLFVCSLLTRGWQVEALVETTALLRKGGWVLTDRSRSLTVVQDEEDWDGKVWTGWPWRVVSSVLSGVVKV